MIRFRDNQLSTIVASTYRYLKKKKQKQFRIWLFLIFRTQPTFIISSDESENVIMPQHDRLIDFRFSEPRTFLSAAENFNSHVLPSPSSFPNLPESALSDCFYQLNLPSDTSLHEQWQTCNYRQVTPPVLLFRESPV